MPDGKLMILVHAHDRKQEGKISRLFARRYPSYPRLLMNTQRLWIVAVSLGLIATSPLFGNGGAWQTGVPSTGNAAATDQKKTTNVTIEDEKLTIDLHQEFAAVEVRYRMKNTGGQVDQDFFFPVERWAESDGEDAGSAKIDLEDYTISADGTELKFETVDAKGE